MAKCVDLIVHNYGVNLGLVIAVWMLYKDTLNLPIYSSSLTTFYSLFMRQLFSSNYYYLLLNRTRSTEYSMKINKLRSQLARANVQNNVVQLVAR